ncbi:MAG: hypothetical protein HXY46_10535 [Syntrophaceae bacterium]|nr:hypothetical protein [Syntrophaceae bacterium]
MVEARVKVGGIMSNASLAMVNIYSIRGRPDVPSIVLHTLGEKNINIEFIVHTLDLEGNGNLTFCIDRKDLEPTLELLEGIKSLMEAKAISSRPDVAVVSVFGPHFREKPFISGLILNALGISGIHILAISTSISSCSCLIQVDQLEDAMRALHQTFEAPHQVTRFAP